MNHIWAANSQYRSGAQKRAHAESPWFVKTYKVRAEILYVRGKFPRLVDTHHSNLLT
jgi:hypothetical protein